MEEKFFADFPKFMLTNIDKSSNIIIATKYLHKGDIKMTNIRKQNITKADVMTFAKESICYYAKLANRTAKKGDATSNNFNVGRISALEEILQHAGYAVESVVKMNTDYTIQTIIEIKVDEEVVFKA